MHGTHVTAYNSTNYNVVFFFVFLNNQLIVDYNALDKRGKIFCVTTYLETKSLSQNRCNPLI